MRGKKTGSYDLYLKSVFSCATITVFEEELVDMKALGKHTAVPLVDTKWLSPQNTYVTVSILYYNKSYQSNTKL